MGKKKMEKMQRKEEEKKQREWMEAQREDAKRREALKDEERRTRRDEEERAAKAEADAEAKRLEEIRLQDEAEYALLKQSIVVEQSGTDVQEADQVEALLDRMATFIKDVKVVSLDELASEFGIRMQDAIKHLKDLDASGRITGVLDDRGKYICISPEELGKVAQFITKRGRVSRTDLAAASNRLVDLNPRKRADAGDIPADVFAADVEPPQAGATAIASTVAS